jgi:hypothetical protein
MRVLPGELACAARRASKNCSPTKAQSLTIPQSLLLSADEVIQ